MLLKVDHTFTVNDARNAVRNEKIQESQKTYNTADKAQGSYYILNETPEQANARYLKEHGLTAQAATTPDATKPGVADQAQKAEEAAKKAGVTAKAKANQKALPKTHAVK